MKLFEPNNLSRRHAEFIPIEDQKIVVLLEKQYGLSPVRIAAFTGANVSANNFKIDTSAAKYFLKSRGAEAELTFALSELGHKVPRIIRARDNNLVSSDGNACWVLYEFQEGDYFSGKGDELSAAAEAFGELTRAAMQLFSNVTIKDPVPTGLTDLVERSTIDTNHRTTILESLSEVGKHRELLNGRALPMHLDYHPLNLLMVNDRVACVVDLEHLKPYSVVSGLGFAAFKLIRQAMVDQEWRKREFRERAAVATWLRGWQKSFPEDHYTSRELGIGARARVLTLIHLILETSLNQGDKRHVYDLEKQILSLYEVEAVFDRIT